MFFGQEDVLRVIYNSILKNTIYHSYLFYGSRGVGKTTIARLFAKSLNCEQGISFYSCCVCYSCISIDRSENIDVIEIDAASKTKVDDIKEVFNNIYYYPVNFRYKIFIIDEFHMLSSHSFNSLLKIIEEPPDYVKIFLATTEKSKIPDTILSRCIQLFLNDIPIEKMNIFLKKVLYLEGIYISNLSIYKISYSSYGSIRDMLSILEKILVFSFGKNISDSDVDVVLGFVCFDILFLIFKCIIYVDYNNMNYYLSLISNIGFSFKNILFQLKIIFYNIILLRFSPLFFNPSMFNLEDLFFFSKKVSSFELYFYYNLVKLGINDVNINNNDKESFNLIFFRMISFRPSVNILLKKNFFSEKIFNFLKNYFFYLKNNFFIFFDFFDFLIFMIKNILFFRSINLEIIIYFPVYFKYIFCVKFYVLLRKIFYIWGFKEDVNLLIIFSKCKF